MSPPFRMETRAAPGAEGCCSPGNCFVFLQVALTGRSASGNLWASHCWLTSPACDSVPSSTKDWSHFPFFAPCGCFEHPRLSLHQPAAFPTAWLTRPSSLLSAHARVTKAVSRVLRYLYFWRTFHLGAQEVRVQISLLQPWLCSGLSGVGALQKSWVVWNSQIV